MGSPENRPRSSVFGARMGWVLGMGARRGCRQSLGGSVRCGADVRAGSRWDGGNVAERAVLRLWGCLRAGLGVSEGR